MQSENNKLDLIFSVFSAVVSAGLSISFFLDNAKTPDDIIKTLALLCGASTIISSYAAIQETRKYLKYKKMMKQR